MASQMHDSYPALKIRRRGRIDRHVDEARRLLWRAYQRGALSDEEFSSTLDRLEFVTPRLEAPIEQQHASSTV